MKVVKEKGQVIFMIIKMNNTHDKTLVGVKFLCHIKSFWVHNNNFFCVGRECLPSFLWKNGLILFATKY